MKNVLPVLTSKSETRKNYDRLSKVYNFVEGIWEKKYRAYGLKLLDIREGEKVLEIGVGPGDDLISLSKTAGNKVLTCGIDISTGMLKETKKLLLSEDVSISTFITQADAMYIPFRSKFFDACYLSFVLELFRTPDIPIVLHECRRILKSNGRICVVALSKKGNQSVMRELYEFGHKKMPHLLDCRPIFAAQSLNEAGFSSVKSEDYKLFGLPVEIVLAYNR